MIRNEQYKDSGIAWIGEIPEVWNVKKAKNIFSPRRSKGESSDVLLAATQKNGMIPQSMVEGVVQVKEDTDFSTFKAVHISDFVISLRSFQGGFEMSEYRGVCSPAYQVFFNHIDVSHTYYKYMFKSYGFISQINAFTVGIREGKNIQYDDFSMMYLPFPNLIEQQAIADYLDCKCGEIDELIGLQEKMIEELGRYKQSVITEAVTRGLNPDAPLKDSGIEWIGEIPEHWDVKRIKYIINNSFAGIWGEDAKNDENDVRCLRVADFDYKTLNISDINPTNRNIDKNTFNQRKVLFNDILIEKSGGGEKSPVGRAVYVNIIENAICSNFVHCIKVDNNNNSKYLVYMFSNMYSRKVNLLYFNQTTGIQNLNVADYLNNNICCPPLSEQQEIADYLDRKCKEIDELTEIKKQKIEQLKEYKKSVIYEYVTGKKRVNI